MDGASTVIALIGFGVQVHDTIKRLVDFLDQVKDAPNSVQRLRNELETLESIVAAANRDDKEKLEDACEETRKAYQNALAAVGEQCNALLELLKNILPNLTLSRRKAKRWLYSVRYVWREDEIKQHVEDLERAKSSFQSAQLLITNELTSRNNKQLLPIYHIAQAIIQKGEISTVTDVTALSFAAWQMLAMNSSNESPRSNDINKDWDQSDEAAALAAMESPTPAEGLRTKFSTEDSLVNNVDEKAFQSRKVILRSKTEDTMFHSPWLGTVLVTRRTTVTKTWDDEIQAYEKAQEGSQTSIRVRLPPWLLSGGYELKIEEIMRRYGGSEVNYSLEPIQYGPIRDIVLSLRQGNLSVLKTTLSAGRFALKDRDADTGKNLLGISLAEMEADWLWAEMSTDGRSYRREIVRTSRWLIAQGLTYDVEADDPFLTSCMHLGAPENNYDALAEAQEMESLLLESTDSSPCLQRSKMLILYAMMNPMHSKQLVATILDLIEEAAIDFGPEVFTEAEKIYWADEGVKRGSIGAGGIEAVIASAWLQVTRVPKKLSETEEFRLQALRGPRRLFYQVFSNAPTKEEIETEDGREEFVSSFANMINILKSLALFEDGFGEYLSDLAFKNGYLDLWKAVLKRANFDPEQFPCRHIHGLRGTVHIDANHPDPRSDLEARTKYYIDLESFDIALKPVMPTMQLATEVQSEAEAPGVLSRLGTLGLDFVTSIV